MASNRARIALYLRRGGAKYPEIAAHLGVSAGRARQLALLAARAEAKLVAPRRGSGNAAAAEKIQETDHHTRSSGPQNVSGGSGLAGRPNLPISSHSLILTGRDHRVGAAGLPSRAQVASKIHKIYAANDVQVQKAQLKNLRREYMIAYIAARLAREPGQTDTTRDLREEAIVIFGKPRSDVRNVHLTSSARNARQERYVRTGRVMWHKIIKAAGVGEDADLLRGRKRPHPV